MAHQLPANTKKKTHQPNDLYGLPFASFFSSLVCFAPRFISTMNNDNVDGDTDDCKRSNKTHKNIFRILFFSFRLGNWLKEMKTLHLCHLYRVCFSVAIRCRCQWLINSRTWFYLWRRRSIVNRNRKQRNANHKKKKSQVLCKIWK